MPCIIEFLAGKGMKTLELHIEMFIDSTNMFYKFKNGRFICYCTEVFMYCYILDGN